MFHLLLKFIRKTALVFFLEWFDLPHLICSISSWQLARTLWRRSRQGGRGGDK